MMDYNAPPNSWTFGKAQQEFELSSGLSNFKGNKIKRIPWSNNPRWQEIIHEQNEELLGATLNQNSANIQTIILKPNETNWEKRQLYQELVNKSINIFSQLKDKKKTKPMVGITKISFPIENANWEMINKLHLKYEVVKNIVYLQLYQLIDSGAESNYLSPQVLACFNPEPLLEKKNNIKSIYGSVRPADDSFIVKFVDIKGNFNNTSARKNTALGVQLEDNQIHTYLTLSVVACRSILACRGVGEGGSWSIPPLKCLRCEVEMKNFYSIYFGIQFLSL